jgi:hypothetical protein
VEENHNMPYNADVILVALLLQMGADVIRPFRLDADDIVVKWAVSMGCAVLSEDTDMMRYPDLPRSKIMVGFGFHADGSIELVPRRHYQLARDKQGLPPRTLDGVPLDIDGWRAQVFDSKFVGEVDGRPTWRRGNSDSFTKELGHLHQISQPLRAALYAKMGLEDVIEIFPFWDKASMKPVWFEAATKADSAFIDVLQDAKEALAWLVRHDSAPDTRLSCLSLKWRAFTRAVLAAELVNLASDSNIVKALMAAAAVDPDYNESNLKNATAVQWTPPPHLRNKRCAQCNEFLWTSAGEREYMESKGYDLPKRCKSCRASTPRRR